PSGRRRNRAACPRPGSARLSSWPIRLFPPLGKSRTIRVARIAPAALAPVFVLLAQVPVNRIDGDVGELFLVALRVLRIAWVDVRAHVKGWLIAVHCASLLRFSRKARTK